VRDNSSAYAWSLWSRAGSIEVISSILRSMLAHAVLSYVFGVVIVAGSVNLISGLFR
jgi:uncharacterized membrane protein